MMPDTIKAVLQQTYERLSESSSPRLDAQVLLCYLLDVDKPYLVAHDDQILSDDEQSAYDALIRRRQRGEPIAYILGEKDFWDLTFTVSPAVLIPRPETEHIIEAALSYAKGHEILTMADIGTGSGAIAVTLAKHTSATMHAIDLSTDALAIARQNATRHDVTVHFHQGSLAQPLIDAQIKVDLLLANLPYIATDDLAQLAVRKHEPTLALDGGADGLDLVRDLLRQVPQVCTDEAMILLEIGMEQGVVVRDYAAEMLPSASIEIIKDLAGLDRIVKITL